MAAVTTAPEISPVSGTAALALLSGAILVIRGRRKH
jgi:LPXTG-motif cell wall-anchored protein